MRLKTVSRMILLAAACLTGGAGPAVAQGDYPNRPIKMVVPIPPGVTADLMPRIIADKLAARWGQPVIIENRPGAGLNLAAEVVAKSPPDGYTLLATPQGPLVTSQTLFPKLRFDPAAFVPVSVYAQQPFLLVANPKVPASTLQEFIAYAKANPGKINSAGGTGTALHLTAEMLAAAAGIHIVHVPYLGAAPAMTDLLAGHVDIMIDNLGNSLPLIREGKLKALGVASRNSVFQNFPTCQRSPNCFQGSIRWVGTRWSRRRRRRLQSRRSFPRPLPRR